ncbi:MAG: hypothetical protein PPP58_07890 [Natronomonas sp.]
MDEPLPVRRIDRRRDAVRIGAGAIGGGIAVVWFREQLTAVAPLAWPPTDPMAVTMALVVGLSVLFPVMVAAFAAEAAYDRVYGRDGRAER